MSNDVLQSLVVALVFSRLDYGSATLPGLPKQLTDRLQLCHVKVHSFIIIIIIIIINVFNCICSAAFLRSKRLNELDNTITY